MRLNPDPRPMSELERQQLGRYGVPLRSTERQRQAAVLANSVYNALSLGRQDMTLGDLVGFLRAVWTPRWAPVDEVVTEESVRATVAVLVAQKFVKLDGGTVRLPVRDRRGLGPEVTVDYSTAQLVRSRPR